MRLKKILSIVLTILFLMSFTTIAAAEGMPLAAWYYGYVMQTNGQPVTSGTVLASVEGNQVYLTDGIIQPDGYFSLMVDGDSAVLTGKLVTFEVVVGGTSYPATPDHEVKWAAFEDETVNLVISELPVKPAEPTAVPAPGAYQDNVEVALSCSTAGAQIYYTLDGSSPNQSSELYSGPINLTQSATIKAKAYKNSQWSNEKSFVYTVTTTPPADPTAAPVPGTYPGSVAVTLSCVTAGAEIYYTLDGSSPSQSSELYAGPINLIQSTTIRAKAFKNGAWSSDRSFAYTITATSPADPTANPVPGTYQDSVAVTLSCVTAGAEIYYTLDGSSPSQSSELYAGPINLTQSTTITAKAYKNGAWSAERSFAYTITAAPPADPTANPVPGTYQDGVAVTLSCVTAGAEIYYTLDGSSPSQSSELYTGTINLTQNTIIKAKSFKNGVGSDTVEFAYTVTQATSRTVEVTLVNSEAISPGRPLEITANAYENSTAASVDWTVNVKDESGAVKDTLSGSGATFSGEWEPSAGEVPGYLPVTREYGLEVSADFSDEVKTITENITLTSYSIVVKDVKYEGGQLSATLESFGYEGDVSCIFQVTRADGTLADLGMVQAGPSGTVSYFPANLIAGPYSVTVFVWDMESEIWQTLANPKTADFTK